MDSARTLRKDNVLCSPQERAWYALHAAAGKRLFRTVKKTGETHMTSSTASIGQTKQTLRLAERIKRFRGKRDRAGKQMIWRKVCLKIKPPILTAEGKPDTGLAYKIAYQGLEPEGRDLRKRLGLRDICTNCKRPYRKIGAKKPAAKKTDARLWFERLPIDRKEQMIMELYERYGGSNGKA